MFSRFETIEGAALYMRSSDIRSLVDHEGHAIIAWEVTAGRIGDAHIKGTADENMERLRAEETAMLVASEQLRQRQANGYPAMPVRRGRQ